MKVIWSVKALFITWITKAAISSAVSPAASLSWRDILWCAHSPSDLHKSLSRAAANFATKVQAPDVRAKPTFSSAHGAVIWHRPSRQTLWDQVCDAGVSTQRVPDPPTIGEGHAFEDGTIGDHGRRRPSEIGSRILRRKITIPISRAGHFKLSARANHPRRKAALIVCMPEKPNRPKTVANLERWDCRWPIGDPQQADFHFCGARQVPGRPYCDLHWRMAIQPPRPRQERTASTPPLQSAA